MVEQMNMATPMVSHLLNVNKDEIKLLLNHSPSISSLGGKTTVPIQKNMTRHSSSSSFPVHRLQSPDEYDYKKLHRVSKYLRNTRDLTLTLEPNEHPNWWVDSSYGVHPDTRSHIGNVMSLGKVATYSTSCKQKLNTKSSTEVELVAIDDAMGQVLWMRDFLAAQGMFIPEAKTIYKDNKSTILTAENGKGSSRRRT